MPDPKASENRDRAGTAWTVIACRYPVARRKLAEAGAAMNNETLSRFLRAAADERIRQTLGVDLPPLDEREAV